MKFENDKGEFVEINFRNFDRILPGGPVKRNGQEEVLHPTENEILKATAGITKTKGFLRATTPQDGEGCRELWCCCNENPNTRLSG